MAWGHFPNLNVAGFAIGLSFHFIPPSSPALALWLPGREIHAPENPMTERGAIIAG